MSAGGQRARRGERDGDALDRARRPGFLPTGSVFPGYPDHTDEAERRAWAEAAARQWERLLEMRGVELAPGGRLIAAVPPPPLPIRTDQASTWS